MTKRTKQIISIVLVAIMVVMSAPFGGVSELFSNTASAEVFEGTDSKATWTLDTETGVLEISGTGTVSKQDAWDEHSEEIKTVIVNEGITTLSFGAFKDLGSITSVSLPNSLTRFYQVVFDGCKSLESIVIPDNVTSLPQWLFLSCTSLKSVTFGKGIKTIDPNAFAGCSAFTDANIKDLAAWCSIGSLASPLSRVERLYIDGVLTKDIVIPESVTVVKKYSFSKCKAIESVTMHDGVTTIEEYAFSGCSNLNTVTVGNAVTSIGARAFQDDTSLKSIVLPQSVAEIKDYAFDGSGLEEITILNPECVIATSGMSNVFKASTVFGHTNSTAKEATEKYKSKAFVSVCEDYAEDNWVIDTPATCTEDGVKHSECTVCGATVVTTADKATGHKYASVVTEPTCTKGGFTTYTCTVCEDTYTANETEKTEHNKVAIGEAKDATCTEDGITAGVKCSVCGEVFEAQQVVKSTGHKYASVVTEPTCTKGGYTTYTCTVCEDTYTADETEKTEHNKVAIGEAKDATCTEDGITAGVKCSVCGEVLEAQQVIKSTGHKYASVVTEPTCTKGGFTTYTCTVCEDTYTADETEKTEHNKVAIGEAKDATCTEDGITAGVKCSVCGEILEAQQIITAGEHNKVAIGEAKDATCTQDGITAGVKCSVCGEILEAQQVIKAEGHKYATVVTAPTCTKGGYTTYTCTVCEDTYTADETEKTEHNKVVFGEAKEPTCTKDGITTGIKCSACGMIFEAQKTIKAEGHKYTSVVVEATCTKNGYTVYTCSVCGSSYNANIVEAKGHVDEDGDMICDVCSKNMDDAVCEEIQAAAQPIIQMVLNKIQQIIIKILIKLDVIDWKDGLDMIFKLKQAQF